ncbi:telomerase-binding protein EST1A-like isoform X2 [Branchiostoma floridae x Branchiostoma belcheri]
MADVSSLRVVRISEEQLQQTAQCHTTKASSGNSVSSSHGGSSAGNTDQVRRPPRRPAMAIYQPGVSRLARKKSGSTDHENDSSGKVTPERGKTMRKKETDTECEVLNTSDDKDEVSEDVLASDFQHRSCRDETIRNSKRNRDCSCSLTSEETVLAKDTSDDASTSGKPREDLNKKKAERSDCKTGHGNQAKTGRQSSASRKEDSPTNVEKFAGEAGEELKKKTAKGSDRRSGHGNRAKTGKSSTSTREDSPTDVTKCAGGSREELKKKTAKGSDCRSDKIHAKTRQSSISTREDSPTDVAKCAGGSREDLKKKTAKASDRRSGNTNRNHAKTVQFSTHTDVDHPTSVAKSAGGSREDLNRKTAEGSVSRTGHRKQAKTGHVQFSTSPNDDSPANVAKLAGRRKTGKQDANSNDHSYDNPQSKEVRPSTTKSQPERASTGSHQNVHSRGIIHLPPGLHTQQSDKQETRTCNDSKRLFDPHKPMESFHHTTKSERNMPVGNQQHYLSSQSHYDSFSRSAACVHSNNSRDRLPTYRFSHHDVHNICYSTSEDDREFTEPESQKWQAVLQQAEALAADLRLHLSQGPPDEKHVELTLHLQSKIQTCYEAVILQDPEFASKHNIDQTLWKNAFYNIIEAFRGHQMEGGLHNVLALIDKGASFYTDLLQKLQRNHQFDLDAYTCHLRTELPHRNVKLALLIAQRMLICLGDISRYREQATGSSNFGKARSFYLKAQRLYPNNGHPYNQLAILAIYTRRKMDAVYFYMRSLAASNPFVTARESLMTLFEEVRRKVTQMEGKKKATPDSHQGKACAKWPKVKSGRHYPEKSSPLRREVWILPPQLRTGQKKSAVSGTGVQPSTRTPTELLKSFELNFLHTHGKLFTKTGMETFSAVVKQTLHEFQTLLQNSPSSIGNTKLLQVMGINMFAVSNCATSEGWTEGSMSPVEECAVRLGMDMFGLLVTTAAHNLQQQRVRDSGQEGRPNPELQDLLPSLKVWADWMTCHQSMWNPATNTYSSSPVVNTWTALADLCNELEESDLSTVTLEDENREGLEPVVLEEDLHLAGFQPLSSQIISGVKYAAPESVQKGIAQDTLRKKSLQLFGQYLCGIESPILMWEHGKHVSIVSQQDAADTAGKGKLEAGNMQAEEDIIIEGYTEEEEDDVETWDKTRGSFQELKAKRDLLAKLVEEKEKRKNHIEAVLDDQTSAVQMEVEVTPSFLVPDTNSFIDNLPGLERLVGSQMFTVVVPLVVINELDGLARGSRPGLDKSSGHAQKLQQGAVLAVQFLEDRFSCHDNHLRALTSKGTSLDTIAFRNEDMPGHQGNNDDVILSCCLHFCHDVAKDYMPTKKGEPIRLKRDVVLLTDDRNLHLKAHTHNVPVKEIQAFIQWSGL